MDQDVLEGVRSTWMHYDRSLLTCLVDCWRPETHTFHFRWGDMAPTLKDVCFLLGLPLAGEAIGPLDVPADWRQAMQARFAGVREGVGPLPASKHSPRVSWLSEFQVIILLFFHSYMIKLCSCTHIFLHDECRSVYSDIPLRS
jgi:hypothetical protein